MNIEGARHRLDFDALELTELHRFQLELQAMAVDFFGTCSRHQTPPVVRQKCLLYEGGSLVSSNSELGTTVGHD